MYGQNPNQPQTIIIKQKEEPGCFSYCCAITCCGWLVLAVIGFGATILASIQSFLFG